MKRIIALGILLANTPLIKAVEGFSCSLSEQSILPPNLFNCLATEVFKEDIFLKTSRLSHRALLDMPLFISPVPDHNDWHVKAHLFWNQTSDQFFTKHGDTIESYLALQETSFTQKIQNMFEAMQTKPCGQTLLLPTTNPIFDIDVHKTIGLFRNISIQERRIGFMVELAKNIQEVSIGLRFPLYFQERNFFITDEEVNKIQQSSAALFPGGTSSDRSAGIQFAKNNLIADRFGIGDMRVFAAYKFLETRRFVLNIGPEATIPISFSIQKGVYGSTFEDSEKPAIDLCDLLDLDLSAIELKDELARELKLIGLDWIKRLSEMLLEKPMGNHGHTGFGFGLEPLFFIDEHNKFYARAAFEYLLPASEQRFYSKPAHSDDFSLRNFTTSTNPTAANNLRFLSARMLDMLFPDRVYVRVYPNVLFKAAVAFIHETPSWGFTFGTDVWGHKRDKIRFEREAELIQMYNTLKTRTPPAAQAKIFGSGMVNISRPEQDWHIAFDIDYTLLSVGIGKDFTVSINLSTQW